MIQLIHFLLSQVAWRNPLLHCVVISVLVLGVAQAGPINYGNLQADNVVYQQVTEDSTTDPTPLYGQPGVSGDSLVFSPVSFGANAENGGYDFTDGTLATTIQAIGSSGIEKVQFSERGDYSLISLTGGGTANTRASVAATLFVRIRELDSGPITPISGDFNFAFNPSDGTYNLIDDPGMAKAWNGGIVVDLDAMIENAGATGKALKVDISMDNQLLAVSEPGTIAYIKKKQQDGVSITAIIPEPATLGLLLVGSLILLRRRR